MKLDRDPLALTPEQMREIGYRAVDLLVDQLTDPAIPAMRRGDAEELRARLWRPASGRPARLGRAARADWPRRARADEPARPSRLLRVHPGLEHLRRARSATSSPARSTSTSARGCRRPARASSSWWCSSGSRSGSATRPRRPGILVSGGSAANITALACARESLLGPMSDSRRRLRRRPDALLGGPGRAAARLPTGPGARAARRDEPTACASMRWPARSRPMLQAGRAAPDRRRQRRRDEHRRGRSAGRARRPSAASEGCGSMSTPPTAASRR